MLAALLELKEQRGLVFNITYRRRPFFLRRDIAGWRRDRGLTLPLDATRGEVFEAMGWKPVDGDGRLGVLFRGAGLQPYWGSLEADTMDSHRLAWYAAEVSPEHGERMWKSLSERYFEGKHHDTTVSPIRLDNHALLLECAAEAGVDRHAAQLVLASDRYRDDVLASFEAMQRLGIHAIPVLIFELVGAPESRVVHEGSGSIAEFRALLEAFHSRAMQMGALQHA